MRIAILGPWTNGYLESLNDYLSTKDYIDSKIYYLDTQEFKLSSMAKIQNIFSKIFRGKGLRKLRRRSYPQNNLHKKYDKILVIRPEFFDPETHLWLRSLTKEYICYLYDGMERFPMQKKLLKYFNKVFSYDIKDCEKHELIFRSNYIPFNDLSKQLKKQDKSFYFIGSYDSRFPKLLKVAKKLKSKNIDYDFTIVTHKIKSNPLIHIQKTHINSGVVLRRMQEVEFLLDLQREKNTGLSFRIFEAMGLGKKLITDNENVKYYDFYNPNNILILDFSKSIDIPDTFLNTPYVEISRHVKHKYCLEGWAKSVFDL